MTLITILMIFFLSLLVNTKCKTPMTKFPFPEAVGVYRDSKLGMIYGGHIFYDRWNEIMSKSFKPEFISRLQSKLYPICPTESFTKEDFPGNRSIRKSDTEYSSIRTSSALQSFDLYRSMPCLSPTPSKQCKRYICLANEDSKTFCKMGTGKPRTLRGFSVRYCVGEKNCSLVDIGEINSTRIKQDTECVWLQLKINCFFMKISISSVANHFTLAEISQLHMKNCGIHGVSQIRYLSGMKWFKYLKISYNQLEELPSNLFNNLFNLVNLDISLNELLSLPSNIFFDQTSVEILNLASNKLSSLSTEIFSKLFALKELNLSGNNLVVLPEIIFHNQNSLMILNLSYNSLSALPNNMLNQSSALWMLDLSSNEISALPGNIFKHNTNLWALYISSNELASVPDDIFNTNFDLVMLDLSSNRLSSLPGNILKHCPWLLACNFSSNMLSYLPNNVFKTNTAIELLDLSSNMLSSLPEDIFRYNTAIEVMYISTNKLSSLPDDIFKQLTSIAILDLSTNMISSLPDNIFKYNTAIKILDLSSNLFSTLPYNIFKYNTVFLTLNLSSNLLSSLPNDSFEFFFPVFNLDLSANNLSFLPDDIFKRSIALHTLDLSFNILSDVPDALFINNHNLITLHLSSNRLSILPDNLFQYNSELSILDLSSNMLSSVPYNIGTLPLLLYLNLSENIISQISRGDFLGLQNLQILDLSHNHLYFIETGSFNNLTNLVGLILIKNNVLITEGIFKGLNKLETLFVDSYQICCVQPNSTKRTNGCIVFEDTYSIMQCVDRYKLVDPIFWHFSKEKIRKIKRSKSCSYTKDAISDCWNLIRLEVLRVFLWTIGTFALLGNILVLLYRLTVDRENIWSSHSLFVFNLSISDFLMGVYMLIIASADNDFKGNYVYYEQEWKKSILCSSAGILCTISSEMSTFLILAITFDRFIVIVFPLSQRKITWKQAACVSVICWIVSTLLGIIPQFSFESYFKGEFYSKSGVCIALPLTSHNGTGVEYSVAVFIVLNSIIFFAVLAASLWMYISMKTYGNVSSNQTRKRDIAVAKTLFYVVVTDFCCWIPVGVMGTMAQLGGHVPDDVYAWVIVFVLPINSAINPFLYTLSYIWRKRKRMQARRRYIPNPRRNRERTGNIETAV